MSKELDSYIQWNIVDLSKELHIPKPHKDILGIVHNIFDGREVSSILFLLYLEGKAVLKDYNNISYDFTDGFKWVDAEVMDSYGKYSVNETVNIHIENGTNEYFLKEGENTIGEIIKVDNRIYFTIGFGNHFKRIPEEYFNKIIVK